ncbi:MAG TPA: sirohydrochlorin chelatase [Candidatus Hypogeohydataceae bacterium YC41]
MSRYLIYFTVFLVALFYAHFALATPEKKVGILILARGIDPPGEVSVWDKHVIEAVKPIQEAYDVELFFGMDDKALQEAVNRLEARGAERILAVPLYISSHSPVVQKLQYYLGVIPVPPERQNEIKPITVKADLHMTHAIEHDPLAAEIVFDRAREISTNPSRETVVLVGHGPLTKVSETMWLRSMWTLASFTKEMGGFKEAKVATVMFGAPPEIKEKATKDLRALIEEESKDGTVLVIPCMIAPGGIEGMLEEQLQGLTFRFGRPYLPHGNVTKWLRAEIEGSLRRWEREEKGSTPSP